MKKYLLTSLAATAALTASASAQSVLVDTQTGNWSVGRNVNVTGNLTSQILTDTGDTVVLVNQYNGPFQLARVVIRYVQPDLQQSSSLNVSVGLQDESDPASEFTSLTVSSSTVIDSSGLASDLDGITVATPSLLSSTGDSDSDTGFTLGGTDTADFTLDYTSTTVIFDSDGFVLNGTLDSVFAGTGSFSFDVDSNVTFNYTRDNTSPLALTSSGADTGRIEILYYAIPEPSSAVLIGLAGFGLLLRRRG